MNPSQSPDFDPMAPAIMARMFEWDDDVKEKLNAPRDGLTDSQIIALDRLIAERWYLEFEQACAGAIKQAAFTDHADQAQKPDAQAMREKVREDFMQRAHTIAQEIASSEQLQEDENAIEDIRKQIEETIPPSETTSLPVSPKATP